MKTFISLILFIIASAITSNAQTAITLEIDHLLGTEDFKTNTLVTEPGGGQITVNRLEFYISKIKLVHDGGQEIGLDSLYILENAAVGGLHQLGTFNINSLEGIKFGLGVDNLPNVNPNDPSNNTTNHADPSLWPMGHALAPKSPSMHWGWASGYRFVAYEGKAGSLNGFTYEIHALGDNYYYEINVPLSLTATNGTIDIELEADHLQGLLNIDVSRGLIEHGSTPLAVKCLGNYSTGVFKAKSTSTEILEKHLYGFKLGPNPSNGSVSLSWQPISGVNYNVVLMDLSGKTISSLQTTVGEVNLSDIAPGIYVISLLENDIPKFSEKVIVTH